MNDIGDKVDEAKKEEIRKAIEELRNTAAGDDKAAIEKAIEKLTGYAHELSAKLYEQVQQEDTAAGAAPEGGEQGAEDIVDADFDVKDDEESE